MSWFYLTEDEVRALHPVLEGAGDGDEPVLDSLSRDTAERVAERMQKWLDA